MGTYHLYGESQEIETTSRYHSERLKLYSCLSKFTIATVSLSLPFNQNKRRNSWRAELFSCFGIPDSIRSQKIVRAQNNFQVKAGNIQVFYD